MVRKKLFTYTTALILITLMISCAPQAQPIATSVLSPTAFPESTPVASETVATPSLTAVPTGIAVPTFTEVPRQPVSSSDSVCGETEKAAMKSELNMRYTAENSALPGDYIGAMAMADNGLWFSIAYEPGVMFYDGSYIYFCRDTAPVTSILVDPVGVVWVGGDATIHPGPTLMSFDGKEWSDWSHILKSQTVNDLYFMDELWIATSNGGALLDSTGHIGLLYTSANRNLTYDNVTELAVLRTNEKFFAHKDQGVTWIRRDGTVKHLNTIEAGGIDSMHVLGGMNISEIEVNPEAKEVWFTSYPGDITKYHYDTGMWETTKPPDEWVTDIRFDWFDTPWILTSKLSSIYNGYQWDSVSSLPGRVLAFGCAGCKFDADTYFIGYDGYGLLKGKTPNPSPPASSTPTP